MKNTYTITEIKEKLQQESVTEEEWNVLQQDERKGVQALIRSYKNKQLKKKREKENFEVMLNFERELWSKGIQFVAGVDEVGRGPLAGPVVAGAVIIDESFYIEGLNDSKQLSEKKRNYFFEQIKEQAVAYSIGMVDHEMIDKINIFQATKLAMKEAIANLPIKPNSLLIDAVKLPEIPIHQQSIVKGDQRSVSIAAASILAKVTRDSYMKEIDKEYPQYQFASNMGYGTKDHVEALREYGPSPYHRLTFGQVKELK